MCINKLQPLHTCLLAFALLPTINTTTYTSSTNSTLQCCITFVVCFEQEETPQGFFEDHGLG